MPLVRRAFLDLFSLAPYVDVMVNAVNTQGSMGKGIALEYKNRHPTMFELYQRKCATKELTIGKIHVYKDAQTSYAIVNMPTKRHFADGSDPEDIKRGLLALRRWLDDPTRKLYTVAMPMLGCGEGRLGYEIMEPIFFDYLDGLDNVIHLSMMPDKMDHIPKYLAIIGPRVYTDYADVEKGVFAALDAWGLGWSDFDAVVSGGATGVDTIACGTDRNDLTYKKSLAARYHTMNDSVRLPIICKADWNRFGRAAGMIRNRTVINIATHVVACLPPGIPAVGTTGAVAFLKNYNEKLPEAEKKKLYIHGQEAVSHTELRDRFISPQ